MTEQCIKLEKICKSFSGVPVLKEVDFELRASRETLESILGEPVFALAYPGGKVNETVLDKAKSRYEMAFVAAVRPETKQTMYTLQRYGVFSWNKHIESIFRNR